MTAEVMTGRNRRKFIPVWRSGRWEEAAPSWLGGSLRIDLTDDPYDEKEYDNLLRTLRRERPKAPAVGGHKRTKSESSLAQVTAQAELDASAREKPVEDVRILRVISDEVTNPRNDGTRGSALYTVPFLLSGFPSNSWTRLFVRYWNRPERFTLRHRPGIARVSGNRILLEGTTIEEVEEVHLATLELAIDAANREHREIVASEAKRQHTANAEWERHRRNVRDIASRITFE